LIGIDQHDRSTFGRDHCTQVKRDCGFPDPTLLVRDGYDHSAPLAVLY